MYRKVNVEIEGEHPTDVVDWVNKHVNQDTKWSSK